MDASEMRQVSGEVQFVCHNCESCCLLEVELRACHEITCGQEILKLFANLGLAIHELFEVQWVANGVDVELWVLQVFD